MKMRFVTALLTAATLLAPLSLIAEQGQDAVAKRHAIETYGKLPLSFEPGASAAHFLARSGNYTVLVGERESSVAVTDAKSGKHQTLRFAFDNANSAVRLEALEPQPGLTNYYLGKDASKWRLGVKSYGKLRAQSVYPGVDVVYYGDHRRLEFDFVVAPKADPSAIALSFSGMDKFYKDASGDLVAEVGGQPVRFAKPYAYQKVSAGSKVVAADYELTADGKVRLRLGDYDRNAELIVDPVVTYISYLGGSLGDVGNGIAVDKFGAAYVTGQTCSSDFNFPVRADENNGSFSGSCDAYVTKFSPDGQAFEYITIIGGTNPGNATAVGNGIAVDSTGQAYITGWTNFTDLPNPDTTTKYTNKLNTWRGGDSDAFVAILASGAGGPEAGALVRSSYLGGSNADFGYGIAVDTVSAAFNGPNVAVVGQTCSYDFPAYNAFQTMVEPCVAFVTKLDNGLHIATPTYGNDPGSPSIAMAPPPSPAPVGATYFFSEFFGGQPVAPIQTSIWEPSTIYPPGAIVQDSNSPVPNIEFTKFGGTSGAGAPLWQTTPLTFTPDGSVATGIYWENLGPVALIPTHETWAYGVALDPLGDIFVAGGTTTPNIVSAVWPFERFLNGGTGAWVIKVNGQQSPLNGQSVGQPGAWVYGSALESTPTTLAAIDAARAIAVDNSGEAFVTGTATGALFGTSSSSYKSTVAGGQDAFLVKMNTGGSAIEYATYLGGSGVDQGLGVAVDGSGAAYVTGSTQSTDFPTINPLTFQSGTPLLTLSGKEDAFISKFTTDGTALIFSAYLGGSDLDEANAIAVDTQNLGNMYVTGNTYSTDLVELAPPPPPVGTYAPPQGQYGTNGTNGNGDAFVAMVAGSSLAISTVTPGTLNFPAQDVNTPSVPPTTSTVPPVLIPCLQSGECIQYTNTNSASSITISSIVFSSGEFAQFPMANSVPANCTTGVIAPNSACDIWVVFTPSGQGNRSGTVTITDDASSTPHVVDLSGQGTVPQDALSRSSIPFGSEGVGDTSAPQFVTLQNIGVGALNIAGISITGANASDFGLLPNSTTSSPNANPCGTQLAAGGNCSITVTFTPGSTGQRTGSITINDNSPGSPHTVGLSGLGTTVPSSATPGTLTFPQQAINVSSSPQTVCTTGGLSVSCVVTIANNDQTANPQTLVVTSLPTSGDYQISYQAITNPCPSLPIVLTPLTSCNIQVVFDPSLPGTRTGTLTINGNGTGMPFLISLSGSAGATSTLAPNLTFTGTNVGVTSPAQAVTLQNQSPFAFNVQSVVISGPAAGDFTQTNTCGTSVSGTSAPAPAVPYCTVSVSFTPTATGNRDATLTVNSNAASSPQSISLLGIGTAPLVSLSPATNLTFPNQPLNTASTQAVITLTNSGSGPLNIPAGGITITGTAAGDFSQTNTCGTQVAAQVGNTPGSCFIYLVFTPTALYTRSATLNIADNAIPSPQSIALLGTGVQGGGGGGGGIAGSGTIALSPATVAFGNQQVSTTSAAQTVTLANSSSSSAFTINNIVITGNSDFAIASGNCPASPATLAANISCSIKVTFKPSTTAAETATLTVTGTASNSPQQITLTGTGTTAASSSAPFAVTPSTTGVSVTQNGTAQYTLSVAPLNGFSNSVAFTCSGPVGSSCSITPNPLVMDGTTTKTATLSVNTTGGNGSTANARYGGKPIFLALLPFSIMGMLLVNKRRSYLLMLALLLLCLLLGMVGCGGGSASSTSSGLAPGTYQVVLTATPSTNSSQVQTMTMNLVVTQQ